MLRPSESCLEILKRDSARVAFLVCGGFGVEVLCSNIGIACFTP
ncbi:DUF3265 domain-containing protein [Vibrio parahaemolyticus]|nr:DUF3265 domain-containing protein [Vibrio parahaemolyticus]MDF5278877.1 DUF3265 domain-containing protein [Vibrio parahaemolyticus]NMU70406.1 DUF3265 domain-containing protein [Vibrio parahaemolyticus]